MTSFTLRNYRDNILILILFASILNLSTSNIYALNKSGVTPSALSLPSGPGSIEGLGESFSPQLNSGTATYDMSFSVPPGRAGFEPNLTLKYDSGFGNSTYGVGWRLALPHIQRQTDKGLPYYTDWPKGDNIDNNGNGVVDEFAEFDTYMYNTGSGIEELLPISNVGFRAKTESAFLRFEHQGDAWVVWQHDGTKMFFGSGPAARVQDSSGRIFRWDLEQMIDVHGNVITFTYQKLDTSQQNYIQDIQYNISPDVGQNTGMKVTFTYESRPDIQTDFRPGFELKTTYRARRVSMLANGTAVRSYRIDYHPFTDERPISLISGITQSGRDITRTLPPATFDYTRFTLANAGVKYMPGAPNVNLANGDVDLLDINGDGLPDIIDTYRGLSSQHRYYLNLGRNGNGFVDWSTRTSMRTQVAKQLSSSGTRLVDIDGDGQVDLLDTFGNRSTYHRMNPTNPSWELAGTLRNPSYNLGDPNTRMLDVNNDKLIDVMRTFAGNHYVWLNINGIQWGDPYRTRSPNNLMTFEKNNVLLADMNGDRLIDLVQIQSGIGRYYPATGYGKYGAQVVLDNVPRNIRNGTGLRLMDINGDGRSDLLYVNGRDVNVWINLGLQTTDHRHARFAIAQTITGPYTPKSNTVFRQADINGNGSTDLLWNTYGFGTRTLSFIDFATGEQAYQLNKIGNGIGSTITIRYTSVTTEMIRDRDNGQKWAQGVPMPFQVVKQIEVNDGFSDSLNRRIFSYHNGYYDGFEKEFRGFERSEDLNQGDATQGAPSLITTNRYHLGVINDTLKGRLREQSKKNIAGDLFWQEQNTWEARTLIAGQPGDTRNVVFAAQTGRIRDAIEKGNAAPVQIKTEYDYDSFGNTTLLIERGRMDGSGWDDERITRSTYSAAYPSGQTAWILDKLVARTVEDETGQIYAKLQHFYDDETFAGNNLGRVTQGNLTLARNWHDPQLPHAYVNSSRNHYDPWGNIIQTKDALWGQAPGHYSDFEYDPIYHSFIVAETLYTDNGSLIATASYDTGLGAVTASTDFNQHQTTYWYDTFGRLRDVVKPGDSELYPTVSYQYVLAFDLGVGQQVNWIETQQREKSGNVGTLDSRHYYDGLGRKIMIRSENNAAGSVVVSQVTDFNVRQSVYKQYQPYYDTGDLGYKVPPANVAFTKQHYDALGRVVASFPPPIDSLYAAYRETTYLPLAILKKDEEQTNPGSKHFGSAKRFVYDGLSDGEKSGRLRQVDEIVKLTDTGIQGPLTTWKTRYEYNVLGKLINLTDSQGNVRVSEYDGLGRETYTSDPNHGVMVYGYDDVDNITYTIDAKNQETVFTFDGVSRLTAEYYLAQVQANPGTVPPRPADVTYYYDYAAGPLTADKIVASNTLGRLSWVEDLAGQIHQSYDARGRLNWEARSLQSPDIGVTEYFVTRHRYDTMNRDELLIYPDGTQVDYVYGDRGLLTSIPNILSQIEYDPSGKKASLVYNNGSVTRYQRDARLRLSGLYTTRTRDGLTLQDLTYSFDDVSNITQIVDGRSNRQLDQIGAELGVASSKARLFRETAGYQYDDLYRLIGRDNPVIQGSILYQYDRIGNMLYKGSSTYAKVDLGAMRYGGSIDGKNNGAWNRGGRLMNDPPGPSALSATQKGGASATAYNLSYDDNGNLVSSAGQQLRWDHKNRITNITNNTTTARYHYDHNNIRKIKSVINKVNNSSTTDLYINDSSEIRNGQLVKYVSLDGMRLARSKLGGSTVFQATHYYLSQHIGSTAMTLDATGAVEEAITYFPYGDEKINSSTLLAAKSNTPYSFAGKERDKESGYHYFEQRYLSAPLARFISTDPVTLSADRFADPQSWNAYAYARNNPLAYRDPTGECFGLCIGAAVMGALWVADKAYAAYEAYQDVQAIRNGQKTASEVIKDRAVEQAAGLIFGAVGRVGVKAVKKITKVLSKKLNPCSFDPKTEITTVDGLTSINELEVGDWVLGRDKNGREDYFQVVGILTKIHQQGLLLSIQDQNGKIDDIHTTSDHPFYRQGEFWIPAGELKIGDQLAVVGEGWVTLVTSTPTYKRFLAYDIDVLGSDNFFVGDAQVLVHNIECNVTKGGNPLDGTKYTDKVKRQMSGKDLDHNFPSLIDKQAGAAKVRKITGGDGIERTKVELPGSVNGKDGNFSWIIEPNKTVNHRQFERLRKK